MFYLDMDDVSSGAFNLAAQFNPKGSFLLLPAFNVLSKNSAGLWSRFKAKRYKSRKERVIDEVKKVLRNYQGAPDSIRYNDIHDRGANWPLAEAHKSEADLVCIDLHRYMASLH